LGERKGEKNHRRRKEKEQVDIWSSFGHKVFILSGLAIKERGEGGRAFCRGRREKGD